MIFPLLPYRKAEDCIHCMGRLKAILTVGETHETVHVKYDD